MNSKSSVYHFTFTKNIIILVDELECGGPSPLGGGLLLTRGVSCAGTPRVLSLK